jgi:hypothetical protein
MEQWLLVATPVCIIFNEGEVPSSHANQKIVPLASLGYNSLLLSNPCAPTISCLFYSFILAFSSIYCLVNNIANLNVFFIVNLFEMVFEILSVHIVTTAIFRHIIHLSCSLLQNGTCLENSNTWVSLLDVYM